VYKDLRKISAEYVAGKEAEGNAIGGLSVGEPAEEMFAMLEVVNNIFSLLVFQPDTFAQMLGQIPLDLSCIVY